jgi:hypothetical protein
MGLLCARFGLRVQVRDSPYKTACDRIGRRRLAQSWPNSTFDARNERARANTAMTAQTPIHVPHRSCSGTQRAVPCHPPPAGTLSRARIKPRENGPAGSGITASTIATEPLGRAKQQYSCSKSSLPSWTTSERPVREVDARIRRSSRRRRVGSGGAVRCLGGWASGGVRRTVATVYRTRVVVALTPPNLRTLRVR